MTEPSPLLITADRLEQISTLVREWDGGHVYADDANDLDLSITACRLVHQLAQMDPFKPDDAGDDSCLFCAVVMGKAHQPTCLWFLASQLDQASS